MDWLIYGDLFSGELYAVREGMVAQTPTSAVVRGTWVGQGTTYVIDNFTVKKVVSIDPGTNAVTLSAALWTFTQPAGHGNLGAFAHGRNILAAGNELYELVGEGTGAAVPAPFFTHPSAYWGWTAVWDGPGAIYAAGIDTRSGASTVYKFILSNLGEMPTLSSGIVAANLPAWETVYYGLPVLGTYVVLQTKTGVRAGMFTDSGDIQIGPMIIDYEKAGSAPWVFDSTGNANNLATRMASVGRFVYGGIPNNTDTATPPKIWMLDLSTPLPGGYFPYQLIVAGEETSFNSYPIGVVDLNGTLWFATSSDSDGGGLYWIDPSARRQYGHLTTGKIRFGTLEDKLFRKVRLRAEPLAGSIRIEVIRFDGTSTTVATFDTPGQVNLAEQSLDIPPDEYVQLKFTLGNGTTAAGGGSASDSPTMHSYQLKALPAAKNQRLLQVTLSCFDRETDSSGNRVSGDAMARLLALEALEENRDVVQFQDLNRLDGTNDRQVVIDEVDFI